MKRTKKFFFIILGILVPSLMVILTLELLFGTWIFKDEWQTPTQKLKMIRDTKITFNPGNLYGKSVSSTYTRDKYGLRGSCSNPKDIKILTIGGSTTDQRYIADGQTYQDILQLLLTKSTGRQICVTNAGVDGHSTRGHIESFRSWFPLIDNLKPEYILFYVGINDAFFRNEDSDYSPIKESGFNSFREALRYNSVFYSAFRNFKSILSSRFNHNRYSIGHALQVPDIDDYKVSTESEGVDRLINENTKNFEKRFRILISQAQSFGATPICMSQPHLFTRDIAGEKRGVEQAFKYENKIFNGLDYELSIESLNRSMQKLCLEADGIYIDLAHKKFRVEDFYDTMHMTPSGTLKLGNYIFQEFPSLS